MLYELGITVLFGGYNGDIASDWVVRRVLLSSVIRCYFPIQIYTSVIINSLMPIVITVA